MTFSQGRTLVGLLALAVPLVAVSAVTAAAAEHYTATLKPLNGDKIGASATGTADLTVENGKLLVRIDVEGLVPQTMHLQHFHGFPDGRSASCPTAEDDTNGDGYIDLIETEPKAGTTMVPFHGHPATLEIPSDTYPLADAKGAARYEHSESVEALEAALKEKFKAPALALPKRVVFIHGVAGDAKLPDSVKSLPGVPAQVTIPVACGVIEAAE
jgi:hypothetical protein